MPRQMHFGASSVQLKQMRGDILVVIKFGRQPPGDSKQTQNHNCWCFWSWSAARQSIVPSGHSKQFCCCRVVFMWLWQLLATWMTSDVDSNENCDLSRPLPIFLQMATSSAEHLILGFICILSNIAPKMQVQPSPIIRWSSALTTDTLLFAC